MQSRKSRIDVKTISDNISIIWGNFPGDTPVTEDWPIMEESFYKTLDSMYQSGGGADIYVYEIGPGRRYMVEIVDLRGTPWILDDRGVRWYRDVRLTLKILKVME